MVESRCPYRQLHCRSRIYVTQYTSHNRGQIVRKFTNWLAAILLLVTSQVAVAQRGGRGTGGTSGTSAGSYPRDTDNDIKDIQKTFAVQATAEQKAQFQSWSQNTETIKLRIEELRAALATNDFSGQLNALKAAIEKSNSGYHAFVSSLTDAQHTGLKKPLQKLGKTNDEMAKAVANAIREVGQGSSPTKREAKLANSVTAVENLLNQQKNIVVEMSIST